MLIHFFNKKQSNLLRIKDQHREGENMFQARNPKP